MSLDVASTKEFWSTIILMVTALTIVWKGLRALAVEVRKLVHMITYTQDCLEQYGPTLLEIAKAFHGDSGKSLIDAVKRIEALSESIAAVTKSTQRASDRSIDVLQKGVLEMQQSIKQLSAAFDRRKLPVAMARADDGDGEAHG